MTGKTLEVGQAVRKEMSSRFYGLYVVVDTEVTGERDPLDIVRGALKGGARILQLRDKISEKGKSLSLAKAMKELCLEHEALLIVNDHADLAFLADADGLHVGQGDLTVADARRIIKPEQIVGRSNYTVQQAVESEAMGTDHVAIGNVYATTTKESIRRRAPIGPETVQAAKEAVDVPVVAIGGITEENVEPVVKAGADAVCVASAVGLATDPEEAAHRLVTAILRAGGRA